MHRLRRAPGWALVWLAASLAVGPGLQARAAQPEAHTLRVYGFGMGGVLERWEQAYRAVHPEIGFANTLPTSDVAFPGLVTYQADLGVDGGEPAITEALSFHETHGYPASFVVVASGAFDVEGRSNGPVVFVHKHNPIRSLSIEQLDGIFGAERNGALDGFVWRPEGRRGPEKDIRRWGQLGLRGAWKSAAIQTYGHGPSGTTRFFAQQVLGSSDKWNPNYRAYVETGSKQIAASDRAEQRLGARWMLGRELAADRLGIAWSTMSQAKGIAGIKLLAIAPRGGGSPVKPSQASFADRSYPLVRNIYVYFDRKPGSQLKPELRGFLGFVLSREGQSLLAGSGYLPLPPRLAAEQLAKLQ